ncbi:MAG: hypothetical protein JOZ51_25290, partial [Chloroflexi bacterium]|nr:hypothetical protein [Chloroflexota bacterium]
IEEFLIRKYWYQTPFGLIVYITHCEWTHRQKNHLVTITRALPNWVTDLSGSMGERPCLGIKARLHFIWPHHHTIDVLIGCVHIIATPTKAPTETKEMIKFVDDMNGYTNTNGWILCGDFNADPQVTGQVTNRSVQWAPTWSQINQQQYPIDYLVSSTPAVTNAPFNGWQTGTAMSDHRLMAFIQQFGPVVQIL